MRKKLPKPKYSRLPLTRRAKRAKLSEAKQAAKAMSTRNPNNQIEKIDDSIEIKNYEYIDESEQKAKNIDKKIAAKKATAKNPHTREAISKSSAKKSSTNQKKSTSKLKNDDKLFGRQETNQSTAKKPAHRNTNSRKLPANRVTISKRLDSLVIYIRQRKKKLKQSWETNIIPRAKRFNRNAKISRFSVTNIVTVVVVVLAIVTSSTLYHYKNKWKTEYSRYITQGDKYLEEDQYEDAAKSYMQAVRLKAGDEDTYLKLSEAYVEAKDYQSAVRILEEANSIKVSLTLVQRMNSIINIAEAAGIELETNKVKNDIAATNYQLGQHYFDAGDYTTARIYFSSASEYGEAATYLAQIDNILNIEATTVVVPETTTVPPTTILETTPAPVVIEETTSPPETTIVQTTTVAPETTTVQETTGTEAEIVERTLAETTTVAPTPAPTTAETEVETTTKALETVPTTTATQPSTDSGKDNSYIIPDSSTRLLTREELLKYSKADLRMIRNEIFAREGRLFTDPDLQLYFNKKSWYHGTIPSGEFKDSMLNDVELANVILIMELE